MMKLGDRVRWRIDPDPVWREALVLGTMIYSDEVVLLGTPETVGMPINVAWCEKIDNRVGDLGVALVLRATYERRHPRGLKP